MKRELEAEAAALAEKDKAATAEVQYVTIDSIASLVWFTIFSHTDTSLPRDLNFP